MVGGRPPNFTCGSWNGSLASARFAKVAVQRPALFVAHLFAGDYLECDPPATARRRRSTWSRRIAWYRLLIRIASAGRNINGAESRLIDDAKFNAHSAERTCARIVQVSNASHACQAEDIDSVTIHVLSLDN